MCKHCLPIHDPYHALRITYQVVLEESYISTVTWPVEVKLEMLLTL